MIIGYGGGPSSLVTGPLLSDTIASVAVDAGTAEFIFCTPGLQRCCNPPIWTLRRRGSLEVCGRTGVGERWPPHIGAHVVQNHIRQPDEPFRPVESCSRGGECGECGRRAPALERPPSTRGRSCSLLAPRGGAHRSRWWSAWETTGAAVRGQASKFAPPSNMGRGLTHECTHVSTPILATAIISRDVRVAQGGTWPAYCTVGMILPDLTPPACLLFLMKPSESLLAFPPTVSSIAFRYGFTVH